MKKETLKGILYVLCVSCVVFILYNAFNHKDKTENVEERSTTIPTVTPTPHIEIDMPETIVTYTLSLLEEPVESEEDIREKIISEAQQKLESLDSLDTMEWFKGYKELQVEYSEWIDIDETIYDVFTEEELELLFRIVEAEVTSERHFDSKANVASVIFNRLESENFPNDLVSILTQKSQFATYSNNRYKKIIVSEATILACEYAWIFGDTTYGALFFDSCNFNSWAGRNLTHIFRDDVNHDFYK